MNFTHPAHQEMLFALIKNQVDFILVGGYAVIYHGYVRTTGDMDVWVKPTNENKTKLLQVFTELKFDPEGIQQISKLDFTGVVIFHIGDVPERIDFLSKVQGLDFNEAYNQKETLNLKDQQVPILRLDDLITNKLLANRLKDKADIENLIKVKNQKRGLI